MEGTYSWIRRLYSCALFAVASGLAVSGVRPTLLESLRQYRLHHPRDASIVHLTGVRSEINQISAEETAKQTGKRVAEGEGEGVGGATEKKESLLPSSKSKVMFRRFCQDSAGVRFICFRFGKKLKTSRIARRHLFRRQKRFLFDALGCLSTL